mgnify:CR=1 FL=1
MTLDYRKTFEIEIINEFQSAIHSKMFTSYGRAFLVLCFATELMGHVNCLVFSVFSAW